MCDHTNLTHIIIHLGGFVLLAYYCGYNIYGGFVLLAIYSGYNIYLNFPVKWTKSSIYFLLEKKYIQILYSLKIGTNAMYPKKYQIYAISNLIFFGYKNWIKSSIILLLGKAHSYILTGLTHCQNKGLSNMLMYRTSFMRLI